MNIRRLWTFGLLSCLTAALEAGAAPTYRITDLGNLPERVRWSILAAVLAFPLIWLFGPQPAKADECTSGFPPWRAMRPRRVVF